MTTYIHWVVYIGSEGGDHIHTLGGSHWEEGGEHIHTLGSSHWEGGK